ncbi:MAG: hypothetical protein AW12_02487 [Candidatus Accumulibacter sp. BA-94]|nr:MAG: hypothetical protein AW12_02487 [Candidatus Accumulibacter sp. BA-94]
MLQRRHRLHRLPGARLRRTGTLAHRHADRQRRTAAQLGGLAGNTDARGGGPRPTTGRQQQLPHGRPDDGLRDSRPRRARGQGDQLHHRRFARALSAAAAGNAVHPLRCLRRSLPARAATVRAVLVLARAELWQDAGVLHLRLHRVRLLQLRLPVTHSAGAVLPFRQERDLGARAREAGGRRRQGALRAAQRARRARAG